MTDETRNPGNVRSFISHHSEAIIPTFKSIPPARPDPPSDREGGPPMPPAARVGDMHMCPMVTPGVPPIPHVGGPILPPGGVTVLFANQPAARVGDMCTCVGPPD